MAPSFPSQNSWPGIVRSLLRHLWVISFFGASLGSNIAAQDITWSIPQEGGTPRDLEQIKAEGPGEFRVRTTFEEGGTSPLRHAVSRVELICHNASTQPLPVTLHLDLSDGGKRTDYDTKPESGMKLRDFIFMQPPSQGWRQVDGSTEGWVATVRFRAEPGETKVGLSPWYSSRDYERFVEALPRHPHLAKNIIGQSDGGRDHWELTITDPTVSPAKKQTIFWHAREHAYETWSSFAMEGLVTYLLSDAAAPFRREYVIVLHPMTNVDGVAQGFEYRGGYDFPNARGTATARLTFGAMDRLRPAYTVTWHNWIAPRDRNVVFFTDGQDGKPTNRAWWRFTQLFPSLRSAEHRWKDENTPQRYNWEGRAPLSESNPHQYTMKKYGTRVWGWEMPWWNFSTDAAKQLGASFGSAFLTTITEIRDGTVPPPTEANPVKVPRWEMHEFSVKAKAQVGNPFRDAAMVGEFVSPSGKTNVLDGFYDGADVWRLRFAPEEEGEWSYLLRGEGVEILQRGKLQCTPARGRGFIRVHPENPYAFAQSDGTPFLPMGDTCYGLFDDSPITPALRHEYLATRRAQRFNFVRMTVGHSESRATTNEAFWAWGGTARQPDLDRLNPEFFHHFDSLMSQLREQRLNVELILLNFYRRPYTDTNNWTRARERLWLRHLLARYAAFDHVFLWTIANEYETHPDGKYRLDFPGDVDWVKDTARFLKENDPCRHLVTVHPVISASRRGESPRAPFDPPWRIGEFFGSEPAIDVLSQQTGAADEGASWDEKLQCWTGDSSTLVASLRADRQFKKPVLNTENGYEYLPGQPTEKKQVHHTDKVRRSAWRIACAGGYFAAGFNGTIGHSDVWNRLDAPNHYTFLVKDAGAADQLRALWEFFAVLPFWRMQPFAGVTGNALALAEPGQVYVLYLPKGGSTSLDLNNTPGRFTAAWFDPRAGKFSAEFPLQGASPVQFDAPDSRDWTLLLRLDK